MVREPDNILIAPPKFEATLLLRTQLSSSSCGETATEDVPHPVVLEALNSSMPTLMAPPVYEFKYSTSSMKLLVAIAFYITKRGIVSGLGLLNLWYQLEE